MVDKKKCIGCGTCVAICPVGAISFDDDGKAQIDKNKCIHCGACQASCPVNAIDLDAAEAKQEKGDKTKACSKKK